MLLCIVHRTRPWCARAPVRLRAWCDCAPTVVARMARVGSADSAYRCIIPLAHSRMCQLKNSESIYRIRCWCCQSFRVATHRTIRHLCMLQAFICMPRHHDPRRSSPARVSVCVSVCVFVDCHAVAILAQVQKAFFFQQGRALIQSRRPCRSL